MLILSLLLLVPDVFTNGFVLNNGAPSRSATTIFRHRAHDVVEIELERPLGITVQETGSGAVFVLSAREHALEKGVKVGDVVIGISGIFGDDIWNTRDAGVSRVQSLIRSRDSDFVTLRLERGHDYHLTHQEMLEAEFSEEMDTATMKDIFKTSRQYTDVVPSDDDLIDDDDEKYDMIDAWITTSTYGDDEDDQDDDR